MKIKIIEPASEPQKLPFNPLNNDELATISGGASANCANIYEPPTSPKPSTPIGIIDTGTIYSTPGTENGGGGGKTCGGGTQPPFTTINLEPTDINPNYNP